MPRNEPGPVQAQAQAWWLAAAPFHDWSERPMAAPLPGTTEGSTPMAAREPRSSRGLAGETPALPIVHGPEPWTSVNLRAAPALECQNPAASQRVQGP